VIIAASCALCSYSLLGHRGIATKVLFVSLIAFDVQHFNRSISSAAELRKSDRDYLHKLFQARKLADFMKSRPGLFRIAMEGPLPPNVGDVFGVPALDEVGATRLSRLTHLWQAPKASLLLNVRYFVRRTSDFPKGITPVYADEAWTAFENVSACPRAWIVHQTILAANQESVVRRLSDSEFDPLRAAVVEENIEDVGQLNSRQAFAATDVNDYVAIEGYEPNRVRLRIRSFGPGLLVLSDTYYPGWRVRVNGVSAPIHQTDLVLRGVLVAGGESIVEFAYRPRSVGVGAALSLSAWLGTIVLAFVVMRRVA